MQQTTHNSQMGALVIVLLVAQLFSSTANRFFANSAHAAWIPILVSGLICAFVAVLLFRAADGEGYLQLCDGMGALSPLFTSLAGLLFLFLGVVALEDTISLIQLYALMLTPRWFLLLLVGATALPIAFMGLATLARAIKLFAPILLAIYILVISLSLWGQFDFGNLFPIAGAGLEGLFTTALSATSAYLWLLLPLLQKGRHRVGTWGIAGCLIATIGYLGCILLSSNGNVLKSFPLHHLSSMGGNSEFFQRALILFVVIWIPASLAGICAGLTAGANCFAHALRMTDARPLLLPLFILMATLTLPVQEIRPAWLTAVMTTQSAGILALPFLFPLLAARLRLAHRRKERGSSHA